MAADPRFHELAAEITRIVTSESAIRERVDPKRLGAILTPTLETLLPQATEDDSRYIAAIRQFLLEPEESYSFGELAALWRVDADAVAEIYRDELVEIPPGSEPIESLRVGHRQAIRTSVTFDLLRPFDAERALGEDFPAVLTEVWRTVPVLIFLPELVANGIRGKAFIGTNRTLAERIEQILLDLFGDELTRSRFRSAKT